MRETPLKTTIQDSLREQFALRAFERSLPAASSHPPASTTRIHPALTSFADECCAHAGASARLCGGSGPACHHRRPSAGDNCPIARRLEPAAKAGWSLATRSHPAFAVSQFDLSVKTETYEIFRHPEGGRKDVLRWAAPGRKAGRGTRNLSPRRRIASQSRPCAEIAARMDSEGRRELEAAGVIESKFGPVDAASAGGRRERCGVLSWLHQAPR